MTTRSGHHRKVHLDNLSERQREVLEQVASGKTNLEIAHELGIGFESVKTHVSDILLRLDVSSRKEATAAWRGDQGVLSRLRRTATGFLVTASGKIATAAVASLLVAGTATAIFIASGKGDSTEEDVQNTYLLDDGREVRQALAEVSEQYVFKVIQPPADELRLATHDYRRTAPPLLLGGSQSLATIFRAADGTSFDIRQLNTDFDPTLQRTDETRVDTALASGRAGITITRTVSSTSVSYAGFGHGRGFILFDPLMKQDDQEAIRIIRSFFAAAPDPLSPPPTIYPNPQYTRSIGGQAEEPYEFIMGVARGSDFKFEGRDANDVRKDASKAVGFDIAVPTALPGGMRLSRIRIPAITANPALRSAYLSLINDSTKISLGLMQHNIELTAPTSDWGVPIDTGRQDIAAWEIGDFRNPQARAQTFMAVGHGRTVAILVHSNALTKVEALAILLSALDAVP